MPNFSCFLIVLYDLRNVVLFISSKALYLRYTFYQLMHSLGIENQDSGVDSGAMLGFYRW